MKQNNIILYASPHMNGPCGTILQTVLTGSPDKPPAVFLLYELLPRPCTACGYCKEHNRCRQTDLDAFYKALEACRSIIIISPVYNMGLPAPFKALIDRLQRYYNARFVRNVRPPVKTSKKALLILTAGSDGREAAEMIKRQLEQVFTVINSRLCNAFLWSNADENPDPTPILGEVLGAVERLAEI